MKDLAQSLKRIDYGKLAMSDYSRDYIVRLLPNIDYYLEIYRRCLDGMLAEVGKEPAEVTLVDYGGGHGFLSLAAKRRGVGQVVYTDINPQAAEAVRAVAAAVGLSPDTVLTGDAAVLRRWCGENAVSPDLLMGMDVIEHIYRLDTFFADLAALNPSMRMLFTTGSTPYNPLVVRRLHRIMQQDERQFCCARADCIRCHFPEMKEEDVQRWASVTRGLTFADAVGAVQSGTAALPGDRYNTCDPATGSWTERILPLSEYCRLLSPMGFRIRVQNGFYNVHRRGAKGIVSRVANILLRLPGSRFLAPFIILRIS